jgi:gamma-glutamyltranspeptidase/glutathione hydrolase
VKAIDAVRDHFYRGDIARRIDAFVKLHNGLLRYEDMASFRIEPEASICTDYRGYQVCKPGFWSQGPVTVQTLNLLEGFDLKAKGHNSADYLHTVVESLKLALADRDTYYGDPAIAKLPAKELLSKEYAAARRREIGQRATFDFRPGEPAGKRGVHPSDAESQMARIDEDLRMRDTTGINVVDKDGLMFAATPSGAALPAVIAGDTGIPLTQRAQSFFLIPNHPNELAGGKRPRITLSPTIVTREGRPFLAIATPGGDNQDQSLLQILLNVVEFKMNAQQAIEAPRVQTRHLVSSFDNHAMVRGDLLIDERIPSSAYADLTERGHKTTTRSRWTSGAHPVAIRVLSNGVIEAGVDPYGYRVAHAW